MGPYNLHYKQSAAIHTGASSEDSGRNILSHVRTKKQLDKQTQLQEVLQSNRKDAARPIELQNDTAAHNTGSMCKRETNKTIKYDKKCRLRRTVELSLKMSQPRLKRQKSGKWAFFTSLSFA